MYLHFYVYAYLRKDGTPYYIGKGSKARAYRKNKNEAGYRKPPADKSRIIIVEKNLTDIGALAIERRLIRWYGRKDLGTGILYNRAEGGEGSSHSVATRKKMSDSHTGKPHPCPPLSVETRLKIANSLRGQTRSDDVKKRMSEIKMGELNPFYGKTHSAETRQKQSIALKGKSKAPMSEEAKRKLSESQKKRLAEKRLIRLQSSNEL
jgi:hypothetical protein